MDNIPVFHDGHDFEIFVSGISSEFPNEEINNCFFRFKRKKWKRNKHSNFCFAFEVVKNKQNLLHWNPKEPPTEAGRALFESVACHLGSRKGDLRFYSAIGTFVDYKYGTDLFFVLKGEKRDALVKIDLTIGRKKRSKADFILTDDDLRNDYYKEIMEEIANHLLSYVR